MSSRLIIEDVGIRDISPYALNARVHPRVQIDEIKRSFQRFGMHSPIVIDEDGIILVGHARYQAALALTYETVPCVRMRGLTAAQKAKIRLSDNKLAELSFNDVELLVGEINLTLTGECVVEIPGFSLTEIDRLIVGGQNANPAGSDEEAEHLPPVTQQAVSRFGDFWIAGRHRLANGDAKDGLTIDVLMAGDKARMGMLDVPYNQKIPGNVSGLGKHKHRDFAEASGEISPDQFTDFLKLSFEQVERVSEDGAIVYTFIDWRHIRELLNAGYSVFNELKNLCVWNKSNGANGTFYRSKHELVFVWKVGDAEHVNTFGLGNTGRYRTNVWDYPGVNTFKAERAEELAAHPTVKPVQLIVDAILDVSRRGDIVLDTFGGSGTTLIAAERTGRRARLVEIDPVYCDVTVRRWQKMSGKQALLEATGQTFDEVASDRLLLGSVGGGGSMSGNTDKHGLGCGENRDGDDNKKDLAVPEVGARPGPIGAGRKGNGSDDRPYRVGKGQPPRKNQFKKGVSGNPSGPKSRRSRSLTLHQITIDPVIAGEQLVKVRRATKTVQVPLIEGVWQLIAAQAAAGDRVQQRFFIKHYNAAVMALSKRYPYLIGVIDGWEAEAASRNPGVQPLQSDKEFNYWRRRTYQTIGAFTHGRDPYQREQRSQRRASVAWEEERERAGLVRASIETQEGAIIVGEAIPDALDPRRIVIQPEELAALGRSLGLQSENNADIIAGDMSLSYYTFDDVLLFLRGSDIAFSFGDHRIADQWGGDTELNA